MERRDSFQDNKKIIMIKGLFKLSILDRYIIGKYVTTFLFTLILLSVVAVVFDLAERIEKFISKNIGFWEITRDYYFNFIPWINSLLFPLYALITVIFFTARMADQTEIIPMLSAGISFKRILKPFVLAASLFTLIHLIGNHIVVPRGNKTLKNFENKYIKSGNIYQKDKNVHIYVAPNVEAFIHYFQVYDSSGTDFQLRKYEDTKVVQILTARQIKWKSLPHIWEISDYEIRTFIDSSETFEVFRGEKLDSSINLQVSDFVILTNKKDMMPTAELNQFIIREQEKGSGITRLYEVEKHRRTADPFTTLILSIIGACIATRKVRGGLGLHLAFGIILGVVFIFLSKLSLTFANNEIMPPIVAVWIPNFVFSFVALYLYNKAQK